MLAERIAFISPFLPSDYALYSLDTLGIDVTLWLRHDEERVTIQRIMKTKLSLLALVMLLTMPLAAQTNTPPPAPTPAPASDSWTLSLGGGGLTTTSGNSQSAFNVSLSVGREGTFPILCKLPTELGLRQNVNYQSGNGGKTLLDTAVYYDLTVLKLFKDKLDLFVGPNFGITYGNTTPSWRVAPEGGVRYWFRDNIAFLGRIDYPYDLSNGRMQQVLNYFIGLEVKF
jgi:hypothetical protein